MAFDIRDINLDPNQRWFIRMEDTSPNGSTPTLTIGVFNTLADAQAETARVAFSAGNDFGSSVDILLTADATEPAFGGEIARFNTELTYHLIVRSTLNDSLKIFQIGPFTELPTIEDALMVTEQMIQDRAILELNLGTHTAVRRVVQLSEHVPTLNEGDIVTYESSRRSLAAVKQQVIGVVLRIRQNEDSSVDFHDELELVEWQDFSRT